MYGSTIMYYRKCFDSTVTSMTRCCFNHCAQLSRNSEGCLFCLERLEKDIRDCPRWCRCDCLLYLHDSMWTVVGQGYFLYSDMNARMCSFVDRHTGKLVIDQPTAYKLATHGFALVPWLNRLLRLTDRRIDNDTETSKYIHLFFNEIREIGTDTDDLINGRVRSTDRVIKASKAKWENESMDQWSDSKRYTYYRVRGRYLNRTLDCEIREIGVDTEDLTNDRVPVTVGDITDTESRRKRSRRRRRRRSSTKQSARNESIDTAIDETATEEAATDEMPATRMTTRASLKRQMLGVSSSDCSKKTRHCESAQSSKKSPAIDDDYDIPLIRCCSCLFSTIIKPDFLWKSVNRAHGRHNPYCAFVERPFDAETEMRKMSINYHHKFQNLQALSYQKPTSCSCVDESSE